MYSIKFLSFVPLQFELQNLGISKILTSEISSKLYLSSSELFFWEYDSDWIIRLLALSIDFLSRYSSKYSAIQSFLTISRHFFQVLLHSPASFLISAIWDKYLLNLGIFYLLVIYISNKSTEVWLSHNKKPIVLARGFWPIPGSIFTLLSTWYTIFNYY